ncbi:MAG: GFA family protein [Hyphomicrobiaceae bacterium]
MTTAAEPSARKLTGQCLCGGIRFEITAPFRPVIMCHCRQCAQWTGHAVAATAVATEHFRLTAGEDLLGWYRASGVATRGFCRTCGSSLFWKPEDGSRISILAGSLDPPTGLAVESHIHVGAKSDYFSLCDDVPKYDGGSAPMGVPPGSPALSGEGT